MRLLLTAVICLLVAPLKQGYAQTGYPDKPITFFVHSKPGSAIDITTRHFVNIAARYTDATMLVENRTGGSGMIAMQHVLDKKADGYSVLAMTKSFISTILLTESGMSMGDFDFLAAVVVDPEVLITNRHSGVNTIRQLIEDARRKKGHQKWLGPLVGGVDHLMAVKIWEKLEIKGEWIPFEGGSDALAALLGEHGVVYVGNPVDIIGRPDLKLAAVAAPRRLDKYPEIPTFTELGFDIDSEVLWRGYAVKKGVPSEAKNYIIDMIRKVSEDPEWIGFLRRTGAQNVFIPGNEFEAMVKKDQHEAKVYLEKAGLVSAAAREKSVSTLAAFIAVVLISGLVLLLLFLKKPTHWHGEVIIPLLLLSLSVFLFLETMNFPEAKMTGTAGSSTMPRLWLFGLVVFSSWTLARALKKKMLTKINTEHSRQAILLVGLMCLYILSTGFLGYYLATFLFILLGVHIMSYKRYTIAILYSAGFVAFSYLIFKVVLKVPLPLGIFE